METMENINTWRGFLALLILLILCYWLFKFLIHITIHFTRKNATSRRITRRLHKVLIVFKPLAVFLLLLHLISINPINHSILLVVIGVFGFKPINNYINGIILKMNPLIEIGALLETNTYQGEIKKMLPFGLVLNTEIGERFINYSKIENKGFAVKSNNKSLLRQTLYIKSQLSKEKILDLLFDNPILNNTDFPSLKNTEETEVYKLQYSLENGASSQELITFLTENNSIATTTYKPTN